MIYYKDCSKIKYILLNILVLYSLNNAQDFSIDKIEPPPNWWTGMKYNELSTYGLW